MHYPQAQAAHIAFVNTRGFPVVGDAIPGAELAELERHCGRIVPKSSADGVPRELIEGRKKV